MPKRLRRTRQPARTPWTPRPAHSTKLLALAARDEAEGLGDAPWPPHFAKQEGEAKRVQPSKAKSFSAQSAEGFGAHRFKKRSKAATDPVILSESGEADGVEGPATLPASPDTSGTLGHESKLSEPASKPRKAPAKRTPKHPLIIVSQSPDKSAAEAGLARWKENHPEAASHLAEDDILIDRMRGSSSIWYRIRINLRHVPEDIRPTQQTPDPDDDPTHAWREATTP